MIITLITSANDSDNDSYDDDIKHDNDGKVKWW